MKCPICEKQVKFKDNPFRPFCSERCKLVDLEQWFEGRYVIKGEADESGSDENKNSDEKDKVKPSE